MSNSRSKASDYSTFSLFNTFGCNRITYFSSVHLIFHSFAKFPSYLNANEYSDMNYALGYVFCCICIECNIISYVFCLFPALFVCVSAFSRVSFFITHENNISLIKTYVSYSFFLQFSLAFF